MKTERKNSIASNILVGIMITGMFLLFSECATKAKFQPSRVVPAAQGDVKVKSDHNNNYAIQINIESLAEVEKLQTSKNSYVAWMETDQGRTINLGQLKSSSGLMSSKLKASLETKSSFKPVKIFVTTEQDTNASYPSTDIIMETNRF
ncbi:MAG: hypothetical protein U5K79_13030 [Cyclobacteriaceae bacterium]|nr:hypothetical protein [Cyclobacteriaceae bacterium]